MNFAVQPDAYANKVLQYNQNIGQQRQVPNTQHQAPITQQSVVQRQQHVQESHNSYNPQLALFTFEKGKYAESWEDVEAEQQHVTVQDLQSELTKFRRNKCSVKRVMNEIPSANCRRLINELVENQSQQLFTRNRSLQWTIAMVDIDWKSINRRQRKIKRVSVILQTEPSGFHDPHSQKAGAGSQPQIQMKSDLAQPNMNFSSQVNSQNPNMGQLMRSNPHQAPVNVGQMQSDMHIGAGPPPPAHVGNPAPPAHVAHQPPPPGAMGGPSPPHPRVMGGPPLPPSGAVGGPIPPPPPHFSNGPPPMSMGPPAPPPPPPAPIHNAYPVHGVLKGSQPQNIRPQHNQQQPPLPRVMPGAFPRPTSGHGNRQVVEIVDPYVLKGQRKHKVRHEESASETDSDEWTDNESGSSGSDQFRVHAVEKGEYDLVDRRGRRNARNTTRSRKSGRHSSHSRVRSRSRSQARRATHTQPDLYRRRRYSDPIDPPPMGKHSSWAAAPRNTSPQLPPIHIHMSTSNEHAASSKDQKRHSKPSNSQPMSRDHSWDRDSGTASFNDNSSIHTADDSVFSEPIHRRHHRRHPSRTPSDVAPLGTLTNLRSRNLPPRHDTTTHNHNHNYNHPHPSHIYDDVPRRARLPPVDDYPHNRDQQQRQQPYLVDSTTATVPPFSRPTPHRRTTTQPNPFDTARFPAQTRAMSYAAGMGTATGVGMGVGMGMHEHNYNHLHFEGFHDELERIRERDAPRKPLYRRSAEQRRQGGEARAWDEACCLPEAPRGGGYAGYAGYAGFGGRW